MRSFNKIPIRVKDSLRSDCSLRLGGSHVSYCTGHWQPSRVLQRFGWGCQLIYRFQRHKRVGKLSNEGMEHGYVIMKLLGQLPLGHVRGSRIIL